MPHRYVGSKSSTKPSVTGIVFAVAALATIACTRLQPAYADFIENKRRPFLQPPDARLPTEGGLCWEDCRARRCQLLQAIEQIHRQATNTGGKIDPPYFKLDTPGGDVVAAMTIGRLLRKERAYVQIDPDAVCLSACVLVLAGAVEREVQGKIGIHRPYFEIPADPISTDNIKEAYQNMLQQMRIYLRENECLGRASGRDAADRT